MADTKRTPVKNRAGSEARPKSNEIDQFLA
jgi:hypothetical protein